MEQPNQIVTFDETSMEQSIGFVKALQELKNLRPQLYSAAEYCEKSYLNSEQKQMVLDNLKDYAIRALVNAVDHLGTVAYKLTDLIDQQTLEISSTELHVTSLHQQLLTCQTYTDREAIRQQQLLAVLPRHHKHYILPNSVSKKVHFSPQIQTNESHLQPRPRQFTSGTPAANTLSWHLATETKSTLKGSSRPLMSIEDSKTSRRATPTSIHTSNGEESMGKNQNPSTSHHLPLSNVGPASSTAMQALGITQRDPDEGPKPMTPFRSFDNSRSRAPVRSRSLLSAFFVKQKTGKQLKGSA